MEEGVSSLKQVCFLMDSNSKRLVKNTYFLYIRMIISIIISLYTSRIILNALGVEDFGVYNVVGGAVAIVGFLSSTMTVSTNRFLSISMGKGDYDSLNNIFSTAISIHIILSIVIFLLGESIGLWVVNNILVFPQGKMFVVNCLYQLSLFSVCITITQIPYDALIIAHEDIHVFAYLQILNTVLKLLIALSLLLFASNRLFIYGILVFIVSILMFFLYILYTKKHYEESRYRPIIDKNYVRDLSSFAGWDILGHLGFSVRQQGTNMLLNIFFGAAINAASGIATTVQGVIQQFSSNIITASRPQIIKYYAAKEYEIFQRMIINITQLTLGMMLLITVPLIIYLRTVLELWLKIVPDYCYQFTIYCLIGGVISSISSVYLVGIHAVGTIKYSSLGRNILYFISVIVTYILFKEGYSPTWGFIVIVVALFFAFLNDCIILRKVFTMKFQLENFIKILLLLMISIACGYVISFISIEQSKILTIFVGSFLYAILFMAFSYLITLNKGQKRLVLDLIISRIKVKR